ncbi:DUF1853 family protein [Pseudomonas sp. MM211]|uniref:DUF1853 family protein n=1 Tax=Pseudomonas sp. MM211 TaxID=2866808 RepID=UPI001CECB7A7|nr:DUF1853 family protein [Pseudomonas sp. MM211]UCJ15031.1 DUF1853 family protein [Pseudomonas sp. MM211]
MNPFAPLVNLPRQLIQPAVRDLAWTLLSPPLLAHTHRQQRHPLIESAWAAEPSLLADWLLRQDQDCAPLQTWLSRSSVRRLGLYYERLWQFALHAAPGVEILAANLPIRQGGHTLGELDLLLRDGSGVHHLELAIKLYLGAPSPAPARWIGPGSHDRLDLKLEHLTSHQLPLSAHPEARPALDALTGERTQAAMWIGGYLFYPHTRTCLPPEGAHPAHLRGVWLHRSEWPGFQAKDGDARWQPLPRHAWLAPARMAQEEGWSSTRLQAWLDELPEHADAKLLVDMRPDASGYLHERQRLFLVDDDWPVQG